MTMRLHFSVNSAARRIAQTLFFNVYVLQFSLRLLVHNPSLTYKNQFKNHIFTNCR